MRYLANEITLVALFASLTAVGAAIHLPIPFTPVAITLQTLFVYLAGSLCGSRIGTLSQLVYMLLGAIGIPVFAGYRAGFQVLLGPTGGYIIGFIPATFLIGKLNEKTSMPSLSRLLTSMILGTVIIYFSGVIQMAVVLNIDINEAILLGVLPFVFGDSLKIITASFLVKRVRNISSIQLPPSLTDKTG